MIPSLRHGRPLSLGELDKEVQIYVRALRAAGTPVTVPVVLAATEGIVLAKDRNMLARYGGSLGLNRSWVVSLMRRMGFVKRKATTQAKHQVTPDQFREAF